MGVYDYVLIEPDVELPNYELDSPQNAITWQTRAFNDRAFRLHCLSSDGHLYRATHFYEDTGLTESHGEKGVQTFIEGLDENRSIMDRPEFDWFIVRYNDSLRVTSQTQDNTHQYDIDFENKKVSKIERVLDNF